jgi:hypothetical protein
MKLNGKSTVALRLCPTNSPRRYPLINNKGCTKQDKITVRRTRMRRRKRKPVTKITTKRQQQQVCITRNPCTVEAGVMSSS